MRHSARLCAFPRRQMWWKKWRAVRTFGPDWSSPITQAFNLFTADTQWSKLYTLIRVARRYLRASAAKGLIGLDRSTNGPLPDCDCKYVSVRTMPPGLMTHSGFLLPWPWVEINLLQKSLVQGYIKLSDVKHEAQTMSSFYWVRNESADSSSDSYSFWKLHLFWLHLEEGKSKLLLIVLIVKPVCHDLSLLWYWPFPLPL